MARGRAARRSGIEFRAQQITPRILTEAMAQGGEVAQRAFTAMMDMRKLDIAKLEAAIRR